MSKTKSWGLIDPAFSLTNIGDPRAICDDGSGANKLPLIGAKVMAGGG